MKIVLFDYVFERDKPGITGLSDVSWQLAFELARLGEDIHVVGPYNELEQEIEGVTFHCYRLPLFGDRNVLGHLLTILAGWRTIQREIPDADIIHAPEYLSTALFSLIGRIPIVLTTPGNIYERIASRYNPFDWMMTSILKKAARISAKRCAAINAISRDMKHWWIKSGADQNKIMVRPYGVEVQLFYPRSDAKQHCQWSQTHQHILYVGRLSREKGIDVLLKASVQVFHDLPTARLHIVGDGPERQQYEVFARQLDIADRVVFHGWISKVDLPSYYSAADVCVVPSYSEPLGRIILEAMACRTPVIGSRVGGIPDLVQPDKTGLLFDVGSVDQLQTKLKWLLNQPELVRQMGDNGYQYIQTYQTWRAVARDLRDEIYEPILCVDAVPNDTAI